MSVSFFAIYGLVRQIPAGRVSTYGQIARLAGIPRGARLVGYALAACHDPTVPCHRVVNRLGGLSDAFLPEGKATHRLLLQMEGIPFRPDGCADLQRALWPDAKSGPLPN